MRYFIVMNQTIPKLTATVLRASIVALSCAPAFAQDVGGSIAGVEVAQCEESSSLMSFRAVVSVGEASFASLDREGLISSYELAKQRLMCLDVQQTAESASSFHRLTAMVDFVNGEQELARSEFHRARILQPGYQLPPHIAPEGHPLAVLYEDSLSTFAQETLEAGVPPFDGFLIVGGIRGGARSLQSDVIVQVFDMAGVLVETAWIEAGAQMPLWGPPPSETFANEIRRPVAIGSAVSLLASGVLFAVAKGRRANFDSDEWLNEQAIIWDVDNPGEAFPAEQTLRDLSSEIDALSYGSLGAGILAVGLGVGLSMVW
jgi:hypothetical protein